ncbi:hypothetical protein SmJEL517_g03924 [Synchytrium microbalum]|uniref:Uncharacterized protein n=1 Tax=Synchytrium microbalum TaxID=1806994 RepID=A0A507C145_9FUNG|nr:uncharacterized protein SmJEL517_g03924 [Synchytrium microbalum]TPX33088.1 hypothetical protein SmJEL517_g03924 [Synchytrium microbalum]
MADLEQLRTVYDSFCAFGSSRNLSSNSMSMESLTGAQLDNAKFAKLSKDTGVVDGKKITNADIDITFNKVKAKGARKLDWESFQDALALLAEKKYATLPAEQAFSRLVTDILSNGSPHLTNTAVPKNSAIVDRLTDTSTFPVTHKNRFEDKGLGSQGALNAKSSTGTTPTKSPGGGVKGSPVGNKRSVTESMDKLELAANPPKSNKALGSMDNMSPLGASKSKSGSVGSVYDRLTDTKQYTGTHKLRFNDDGTGRGIAGRDSPSKGGVGPVRDGQNVNDLSQILRR